MEVLVRCGRGYVAIFEIREFELYLKDFMLAPEEKEDFTKQVFPDGNKKLTFINKLIVLYRNKLEGEWSVQEYNTFETYEILEIKNGILTDFKIFNHSEMLLFKEIQYGRYIVSEDYIIAKQKRIRQLELENESLRKLKNKGPQWFKYRFKEDEFKAEIKERVLYHTLKFY
jgi:hypothetical protein